MKKYQKILLVIIIGFMAFPTITLGGTFVFSLIQGKTVEEVVQILAEQVDFLISRVETVEIKQSEFETKQTGQEQTVSELQAKLSKEEMCREGDRLLIEIKETCGVMPFPGLDECITKRLNDYQSSKNSFEINTANRLQELKPFYLSAKAKCEVEE